MSDRMRNWQLLHVLASNPLVSEAEARSELGLPVREDRDDAPTTPQQPADDPKPEAVAVEPAPTAA